MKYEIVERRKPSSELSDWDIRPADAGKGTGRTATVYGRYGTDARATAEFIARVLEERSTWNATAPLEARP